MFLAPDVAELCPRPAGSTSTYDDVQRRHRRRVVAAVADPAARTLLDGDRLRARRTPRGCATPSSTARTAARPNGCSPRSWRDRGDGTGRAQDPAHGPSGGRRRPRARHVASPRRRAAGGDASTGRGVRATLVGPRASVEAVARRPGRGVPVAGERAGARPAWRCRPGDYRVTVDDCPTTRSGRARSAWLDELHDLFRVRSCGEDGGLVVRDGTAAARRRERSARRLRQRLAMHPPRRGSRTRSSSRASTAATPAATRSRSTVSSPGARPVSRDTGASSISRSRARRAVPVVDGSPEWWRARGSARLSSSTTGCAGASRAAGQVVLQTWHGTPLKRLALHRPGFDPRRMAAVVGRPPLERAARPEPVQRRDLRQGVRLPRGPIWERATRATTCSTTRRRAGATVRGLSASGPVSACCSTRPTWRDDRAEMVDCVDPARSPPLPADPVVLVRGHSRTLALRAGPAGPRRLIDVTAIPTSPTCCWSPTSWSPTTRR